MQAGRPSRTALIVAAHRAAHQVVDGGGILSDPFACAILGDSAHAAIEEASAPSQNVMRRFLAARGRFAEECLSSAVLRGVRQVVILGAGLDTFSIRNPHAHLNLRIFEVDHPATQAWKRERLAQARLGTPQGLTFTPVDFERQDLTEELLGAGFQPSQPTFFQWLGVIYYLKRETIRSTLRFIVQTPEGEVVFDYPEPLESCPVEMHAVLKPFIAGAEAAGEPWLSYFTPEEMRKELQDLGFEDYEDLDFSEVIARSLGVSKAEVSGASGPRIVRARHVC